MVSDWYPTRKQGANGLTCIILPWPALRNTVVAMTLAPIGVHRLFDGLLLSFITNNEGPLDPGVAKASRVKCWRVNVIQGRGIS